MEVQTIILFVTKHRDGGTIYNLKHQDPASSIILITSKLYQTWYTPSNVGGTLDDTPDTDGVVAGQQMRTTTVGRERVCACLLC